jgi:antitoxin PrlF
MPTTLDIESTLTDRYQTTIPETVRRVLGLNKRDKLHFSVRANGEVVLSRAADAEGDDPALSAFLTFLANDIASHPERLEPMTGDLLTAIRNTTAGVDPIDLDALLSAEDE